MLISLLWQSLVVNFVMMELDPSAPMDPRLFTTDQLERTQKNLPTIHHQFAMEKELLAVLTDQLQKSDSTLAPEMRRNAQQDKVGVLRTNLSPLVLMAQSVAALLVARTALSATESVAMDRLVARCAVWDNLTAPGSPRTGTSMMESRPTTLEL